MTVGVWMPLYRKDHVKVTGSSSSGSTSRVDQSVIFFALEAELAGV